MHARQCIVRKLGVPAAAAVVPLDDAALENDPTLLLATAALADQQQIALADPADPASLAHHHLVRYAARSDADGYFRLPPLSRSDSGDHRRVSAAAGAPRFAGERRLRARLRRRRIALDLFRTAACHPQESRCPNTSPLASTSKRSTPAPSRSRA